MTEVQALTARLERLEKRNRLLTLMCGACLAIPILAIVGWQSTTDTVRVKRLEVIDDRGVPMITLSTARNGQGGSIVMRDSLGEKRSWWEVGPETGAFTITSAKDGSNDTTLGMQVGPRNGRLAIISKNGALLSTNMEGDDPRLELYNAKGGTLFAAPLRPKSSE